MAEQVMTTKNKALQINLDPSIYGTISEIGGGQEVSRHFFQAGGASGTIAKTISAYDKTFSDTLYNKGGKGRYVSEGRLEKMLQKEYNELVKTLEEGRGNDTKFFVFGNTVETLNYHKTNQGHGWLGVRFRLDPKKEANTVIIHVNLLENDGILQQYTLGALGVNLVYACFNHSKKPNSFLRSLMENLDRDRVEVNYIKMFGPDLDYVDNRLLGVQLVKNKMTMAVMFDRQGQVQQPSDMLYKKNVIVLRGTFRPITYVGFDMLKTSVGLCRKEADYQKEDTVVLCEMNLERLMRKGDEIDEKDFLDRVDMLNGMGQYVMVSGFFEFYKLSDYFSSFKLKALRMLLGANTLEKIFDDIHYKDLNGGLLQAMGLLFNEKTKLLIYPFKKKENNELITTDNFYLPVKYQYLYQHLLSNQFIIPITEYRKNILGIHSKNVLDKILKGDSSWEEDVPKYISEMIKNRKLFGYKE
ncbi:MAG: nicotinate-nucleotide adenylyltransferase [Marinilabiliales bacterium]|nr:MAG: nicotinate-nucleotide adenylyltransferase [Marinilabiliales bacterium]